MSNKKENHEDLKAFEEALAALRPRSGRLDPEWRSMLAKEAALAASLYGELDGEQEKAASGDVPVMLKHNLPPAEAVMLKHDLPTIPGCSHLWICARCGSVATTDAVAKAARNGRRWAWPAAFSAVTAVAAILLAMLAAPMKPPMVDRHEPQASDSSVATTGVPIQQRTEMRREIAFPAPQPQSLGIDKMSYSSLRTQLIHNGQESWRIPASAAAAPSKILEGPQSYQEQLEVLLKETSHAG